MKGLTAKQQNVLSYIKSYLSANRYAPSYREIQEHFGFNSLGSVHKYIALLTRKGMLSSEKYCSRSLALSGDAIEPARPNGIELPCIGVISAGCPIETFAKSQTLTVPENLVHSTENTYLFRVKGDSLQEELMADGDILIVEARQIAHPGEMIVGLINQHDTIIKRYYPEGAYVRLVASNPHVHPIIINSDDIQIQAVVTGLLRGY